MDLLDGKVREAEEMRLFVERGNYYNFGFAEDGRWQHFVGTSPDLEDSVNLYAARGTQVSRQLEEITSGGMMRVTLSIRSTEGSFGQGQFEVVKILVPGWVVDRKAAWNPPVTGESELPVIK